MAAPIDLSSATTAEGQQLMLLEHFQNLQRDTEIANVDGASFVTATNYSDATGVFTASLSFQAESTVSADGFSLKALEVFYPKVV